MTIGSGITVQCIGNAQPAFLNAGSSTIDNQGIINANDANANFGITLESGTGGSWKNDNTVEASNGGNLTLTGNWTNNADGSITVTGSTLNLSGTWSNADTFTSQGASSVNLGGTFGLANLGNYTRDAAGKDTFNVVGTLNLAGQTLNASAGPGLWEVENGTIENGTIGSDVTFDTVGTNTSTLQSVTMAGTLNFIGQGIPTVNASALTLAGGTIDFPWFDANLDFSGTQTLGGTGTVEFADGGNINATGSGGLLTIGSGITVQCIGNAQPAFLNAGSSTIDNQGIINADDANASFGITLESGTGGSWKNDNVLEASNGGNLTLTGNWTNNGSLSASSGGTLYVLGTGSSTTGISESSGTVNIGSTFTTSALGALSGNGGTFNFTGTLNNTGNTLTLNGSTVSPLYSLAGGTITGGTITTSNGAELIAGSSGTLSGVMLGSSGSTPVLLDGITLNRSVTITNGLTLANSTSSSPVITLEGTGALKFVGSQSLAGSGDINFNSTVTSAAITVPNSGTTLTIGSGVTIDGYNATIGGSTGGTITINGTIASDSGSTVTVQSDTNYAGGTLTGGTWEATGNSTLRIIGASISTNAANLVLGGAGSNIYSNTGTTNALANLTANSATGALTLESGAVFSPTTWTNAGSVTIGSGSILNAPSYTQTAGNTILQGGVLAAALPPESTSLSFNGSNDVHVGSLGARPTKGTISFWMDPTTVGNYQNILTTGPTNARGSGGNQAIRFEEDGDDFECRHRQRHRQQHEHQRLDRAPVHVRS